MYQPRERLKKWFMQHCLICFWFFLIDESIVFDSKISESDIFNMRKIGSESENICVWIIGFWIRTHEFLNRINCWIRPYLLPNPTILAAESDQTSSGIISYWIHKSRWIRICCHSFNCCIQFVHLFSFHCGSSWFLHSTRSLLQSVVTPPFLSFQLFLGLPTPKKYKSFCTIRRFIKFMVVSSVSPKS